MVQATARATKKRIIAVRIKYDRKGGRGVLGFFRPRETGRPAVGPEELTCGWDVFMADHREVFSSHGYLDVPGI